MAITNSISSAGTTAVPRTSSNDDCYFYYYSSCVKGSLCPYRHEPAALRNETMCRFWLLGNCSKPNCIFRHMEIMQPRDKIPCFFESQPGGCKKVHCPFLHNNILDQPREEDKAKNPDIILPTSEVTNNIENTRQSPLLIQQRSQLAAGGCSNTPTRSPEPLMQSYHDSVIISLSDLDSDSDTHGNSPIKHTFTHQDLNPERCSERQQELLLLHQVQQEQASIIGYTFDDDSQDSPDSADLKNQQHSFVDEIEEIVEFTLEDEDCDNIMSSTPHADVQTVSRIPTIMGNRIDFTPTPGSLFRPVHSSTLGPSTVDTTDQLYSSLTHNNSDTTTSVTLQRVPSPDTASDNSRRREEASCSRGRKLRRGGLVGAVLASTLGVGRSVPRHGFDAKVSKETRRKALGYSVSLLRNDADQHRSTRREVSEYAVSHHNSDVRKNRETARHVSREVTIDGSKTKRKFSFSDIRKDESRNVVKDLSKDVSRGVSRKTSRKNYDYRSLHHRSDNSRNSSKHHNGEKVIQSRIHRDSFHSSSSYHDMDTSFRDVKDSNSSLNHKDSHRSYASSSREHSSSDREIKLKASLIRNEAPINSTITRNVSLYNGPNSHSPDNSDREQRFIRTANGAVSRSNSYEDCSECMFPRDRIHNTHQCNAESQRSRINVSGHIYDRDHPSSIYNSSRIDAPLCEIKIKSLSEIRKEKADKIKIRCEKNVMYSGSVGSSKHKISPETHGGPSNKRSRLNPKAPAFVPSFRKITLKNSSSKEKLSKHTIKQAVAMDVPVINILLDNVKESHCKINMTTSGNTSNGHSNMQLLGAGEANHDASVVSFATPTSNCRKTSSTTTATITTVSAAHSSPPYCKSPRPWYNDPCHIMVDILGLDSSQEYLSDDQDDDNIEEIDEDELLKIRT